MPFDAAPDFLEIVQDNTRAVQDEWGKAIADDYRNGVGEDTGELKASIKYQRDIGSDTGYISADTPYADAHEFGTMPHAIPNAFGLNEEEQKAAGWRRLGKLPDFHPGTNANGAFRRAISKGRE